MTIDIEYTYDPAPTIYAAHKCVEDIWIKKKTPLFIAIKGPPGSGKTVGCVNIMDMVYLNAPPDKNGDRHVTLGVVRNTVQELNTTVLDTLKKWFPTDCGEFTSDSPTSNKSFTGKFAIPYIGDKTKTCYVDIRSIAYAEPKDRKKLKSTEFDALYMNELNNIDSSILGIAIERVGRGKSGVSDEDGSPGQKLPPLLFADYNNPVAGNWTEHLHEQNGPVMVDGEIVFEQHVFVQPPAAFKIPIPDPEDPTKIIGYDYVVNKFAENIKHVGLQYYAALIALCRKNGDFDSLDRELCMLPTADKDGMPVFLSDFSRKRHVLEHKWDAIPERRTVIGVDTSGIHPSAVFFQKIKQGWVITDELYGQDMSTYMFLEELVDPLFEKRYSKKNSVFVCDFADPRNNVNMLTPMMIIQKYGYNAIRAVSNKTQARINAVKAILHRDGPTDSLYIAPNCAQVIIGFETKYIYKRQGSTTEFGVVPVKNTWSHYMDAVQYGLLHIYLGTEEIGVTYDSPEKIPKRYRDAMNGIKNGTAYNQVPDRDTRSVTVHRVVRRR